VIWGRAMVFGTFSKEQTSTKVSVLHLE
jgi:hypothetical protein